MTDRDALACPGCSLELGADDVAAADGFACCAYCDAVFLVPERLADSLAFPRDPVSRPRGLTVSRVIEKRRDAYRSAGTAGLPVQELVLSWSARPVGWMVAMLAIPVSLACGSIAAKARLSTTGDVITAVAVPALSILAAAAFAWLNEERRSVEVRAPPGSAPRLVVSGVIETSHDALEIQSVHVQRRSKLERSSRSVGYDVLARIGGQVVELATFRRPARALYVANELRAALGL